MAYSIGHIAGVVTTAKSILPLPSADIRFLLIDSRQLSFPESTLFFALKGSRQDGHQFIDDLYARGLRNFVVQTTFPTGSFPDANFLLVKDPLTTLQELAAYHRRQFSLPVVGITGSNGKTIVKEWLYQLLHNLEHIVRSPKSYNSQIGVPMSVWNIRPEHTMAIFEAGISQCGEMEKLERIIQPDLGIFTNIGPAHSEGFADLYEKVREKARLFAHCRTILFCRDHEPIRNELTRLFPSEKLFSWSMTGPADLRILSVRSETGGTRMTGLIDGKERELHIPFSDEASIENALHCWAFSIVRGYAGKALEAAFSSLEPIGMRLELKAAVNQSLLINDAYNNDLHSLKLALDFLEQQGAGNKRTIILSDILQSGMPAPALYGEVAELLKAGCVQRFIGIGTECRVIREYLDKGVSSQFFPDTTAFLGRLPELVFEKETILLKGARPFRFEQIADRLVQKVHKTSLEVDLDALRHNLNQYSAFLQKGVRMMVMVKASGYGSGSAEVARLLAFQNVDYLAVAYADEGIELRKAGIRLPILVLNPEEATFDALFRHELEPEIYSLALLDRFLEASTGTDRMPGIHLKLETGMNRLGFDGSEIAALLDRLDANPELRVLSVFSHLAASEDPEEDAFTHRQAETFLSGYRKIADRLGYRPLRHLLNSSGIHRFPEYQLDMVRLGIGLYGMDHSGLMRDKLQTVLTLKATISQVRTVRSGETIGYGRVGKVDRESRIAIVSVGYADGLLRAAGNGRYNLVVRGKPAPIVGNVCMDMTMVDVTDIPLAQEGDEVMVFGRKPAVEELAGALGTIPYEVLTNISSRVKRVYFQT